MEVQFILLIAAAGVFGLLLIVYAILSLRAFRRSFADKKALHQSYAQGSVKKMEYDVAFYDKANFRLENNLDMQRQVTIDDVLSQDEEAEARRSETAIYTRVEDFGVEEICGNYNPSSSK